MGPDTFSQSRPTSSDKVNVIDFGFAKKFADTRTGEHIPFSQHDSHGVGTPLFASINTHKGEGAPPSLFIWALSAHATISDMFSTECSRRDDLESLAYTLIYFLRGTLPWRKLKSNTDCAQNPRQAWDRILAAKQQAEASCPSPLTAGFPPEFDLFYRYTRALEFEDLPDYEGCRNLFRGLAKREGIEYDGVFDWSVASSKVWRRNSGKRKRYCAACAAREAAAELKTRRTSC